jgi:hypothetical protein
MGGGQGHDPQGQYGANADPKGNGWGQQFMQQYGAPPGQMKDEWQAYKTANNFGGGQNDAVQGMGGGMGQGMGGMGGGQMPPQNPMAPWLQMRPQFGQQMGGQGGDRMQMLRAWLAQRNRGLLGQ